MWHDVLKSDLQNTGTSSNESSKRLGRVRNKKDKKIIQIKSLMEYILEVYMLRYLGKK